MVLISSCSKEKKIKSFAVPQFELTLHFDKLHRAPPARAGVSKFCPIIMRHFCLLNQQNLNEIQIYKMLTKKSLIICWQNLKIPDIVHYEWHWVCAKTKPIFYRCLLNQQNLNEIQIYKMLTIKFLIICWQNLKIPDIVHFE